MLGGGLWVIAGVEQSRGDAGSFLALLIISAALFVGGIIAKNNNKTKGGS